MSVISLTVVSINGKPITPTAYGFETNDIVAPISNDGTYSTVVSRDVKGIDQQARSNAKYIYEVQQSLSTISSSSDGLFLADVTYRKGYGPQYAVNYKRVFPINIVSGSLTPVSGGTQFYVGEDGDPNLVFYQVTQTVAQIVAQTVTPGVYWGLSGNAVGATKKIGTVDNFDFPVVTNNIEVARFKTSGNFGIGTTTPSSKLDVNGDANISLDLTVGTDLTVDTDTLIVNAGTNRVGVGVSGPTVKLDVYSNTANTSGVTKIENQASSTVSFLSTASPESVITGSPSDVCYVNDGTNGSLYIKESGTLTNTGWLEIPNSTLTGTPCEIQLAASDETTALTASLVTPKVTFRMPYNMTLLDIRASLTTAQSSGLAFKVDVKQNGVSILSPVLIVDNGQKTSVTSTSPVGIATSALTDDAEMTVFIQAVGSGDATGLKLTLKGIRA